MEKQKRNRPLNQAKREAIIKASIEEFYDKGYEATSMDTVSHKANVSKATVYNHFKNKEELFLAIMDLLLQRVNETFNFIYEKDKDIEEQLKDMARQEMNFLSSEENMTLMKIATVALIQKYSFLINIADENRFKSLVNASKWFEEAKIDGKLEFDDSFFVAQQFIGSIKSFAFSPQLYGAPLLTKEQQENVIENSVKMIKTMYSK